MTIDIQALADWTAPKEVQTKYGPRLMCKAKPSPAFSEQWKLHKDEVKALGAGFIKDDRTKEWQLIWWQKLPEDVQQARRESVEASKATAADLDFPHPDGLDYLPFQKAGIRYALARPNTLIADEMGLGKTIEAIGIINVGLDIANALVVCPKSLKLNWARELARWLTRPLTVGVVDGKVWPQTDIVIMNYEAVGKHPEIGEKIWSVLILDEAHLIKNPKTQRSKNIKAIKAVRHLRLTGTPIVNRPAELYNIISDLTPVFGSFFTFTKRYCQAHRTDFGWDFTGAANLDELQDRLRQTIMVRRLKMDVLTELPKKIRQVVELEADEPDQRRAVEHEAQFEAQSEARLVDLRAAVELSKAESEEAYRAAVADLRDALEVDFTEISRLRHQTALAKVPQVVEHIRQCLQDDDTKKIVIMAHHHDVIAQIADVCRGEGWRPVTLTGENTELERQQATDAFQQDPAVRVFVGGIQAAGVGITLTAASHVVFAELDWVPGNVTQAEDRLHRIGQTLPVLVQHLVLQDSIDARMANTLVSKQAIIDQALDVNPPERTAPVYTPKAPAATQAVKPSDLEGVTVSPTQAEAVIVGLRLLAGMDQDHAMARNNMGFSKIDVAIGHSLAERAASQNYLSPKQLALGLKLCHKYHRQLPDGIRELVHPTA